MNFGTKGFTRILNTNPKLIFPYDPLPPPLPLPLGKGGGQNLEILVFILFWWNFGINGFLRVLNKMPKLIYSYDSLSPLFPQPHWGGKRSKFLFSSYLVKFGTIGFLRFLNTNLKLFFPYDAPLPPQARGGGLNIIQIVSIRIWWNLELKVFAVSWSQIFCFFSIIRPGH